MCVCAWKYSETTSHRDHRSSFHRDHRRLAAHVLHQNAQPLAGHPRSTRIHWLVVEPPTPLKMMEWVKVSLDNDIPNWMESHKIPRFHTNNQSINGGFSVCQKKKKQCARCDADLRADFAVLAPSLVLSKGIIIHFSAWKYDMYTTTNQSAVSLSSCIMLYPYSWLVHPLVKTAEQFHLNLFFWETHHLSDFWLEYTNLPSWTCSPLRILCEPNPTLLISSDVRKNHPIYCACCTMFNLPYVHAISCYTTQMYRHTRRHLLRPCGCKVPRPSLWSSLTWLFGAGQWNHWNVL